MPKIKIKEPKAEGSEKIYLNNNLKPILDKAYELNAVIPIKVAFHALPSRSYTDYYKVIHKPQSLHKIQQAVKANRYSTAQEFIVDLAQITWNARYYNEIGSDYYETAVVLDNYIKEEAIPSLANNNKVFGHQRVSYPYLGALPGEENTAEANGNGANNIDEEDDNDEDEDDDEGDISVQASVPAPAPKSKSSRRAHKTESPAFVPQTEAFVDQDEDSKEPTPFMHRDETEREKQMVAIYHQAESMAQQQPQEVFDPTPPISTAGVPPEAMADYIPIPVEQVPTLDQNMTMIPKPSPIVLNTTTALPPHPNQIEMFESWNKRGKPPVIDKPHEQRTKNIMRFMKRHRGASGGALYLVFDKVPTPAQNPDYHRKVSNPMCLDMIRSKIKMRKYQDIEGFINDLFLIIENNKTYASSVSNQALLNDALDFENLCRRLINDELAKPDSHYLSSDVHGMRVPIDELEYGGRNYKIGDWVLLRNPNDETKPIPAQIFRIWFTPEDGNKRWINVCWYYRPEQTVHRVDRLFYENEVFKTGQYRDHLVQDILGPCYVNYFTRYQRGEPAFKVFGPMFICEFRYSDHDKNFNKIRTWRACIPDEVREVDDPIIPLPHGGLRFFQKYTSPLMHLLPPHATERDPIPQPIIASMNAPPLIGAVYKRPPALDDDLGQYLSSPARNLVVRKTITNLNNIGTRNDLPITLAKQHAQAPGSAAQSPPPLHHQSSLAHQRSGVSSPQQQQAINNHNNNSSASVAANNNGSRQQFSSQFNYSQYSSSSLNAQSPLHTSAYDSTTHHQQQQQQQQQQAAAAATATSGTGAAAHYPIDYASLAYQNSSRYYQTPTNSSTHSTQTVTGKVVPSPYNQVSHVFSNYFQSSTSGTYILPNKVQQKLGDVVTTFSHRMDRLNKERLMKYSPSFMVTELQNYELMNKLRQPDSENEDSEEDDSEQEDDDEEDEEDEDEEEEDDDTGVDEEGDTKMDLGADSSKNKKKRKSQDPKELAPSLWFRGVPLYIKNRILNNNSTVGSNSHVLRMGNNVGGTKKIKLGGGEKEKTKVKEVKEEEEKTEGKTEGEGNIAEQEKDGDTEAEEEPEQEQEEEEEVTNEVVEFCNNYKPRFGPSAKYLAFKLATSTDNMATDATTVV